MIVFLANDEYAGFSGVSHALQATILADTNRDGKVDAADSTGKATWTEATGALFLANIGDTDRRCSKQIRDTGNDRFVDYSLCHDATDNVQRNAKYLAPVVTLPIQGLSGSATGSVTVDKNSASKVRVFVKNGSGWTYVSSDYKFTSQDLQKGLTLGVDARDTRNPQWDGRATLQFTVTDGDVQSKDAVALRVAPVLTHHPAQPAEQLLAYYQPAPNGGPYHFVRDLTRISKQAGVPKPLLQVNTTDIWTQDFFEPGYTTIPGPDGPIVLRVMIASAQNSSRRNESHRWLFRYFRSDTVGAVLHHTYGDTTDSTGNLETVPPHTNNGKSYPAGRTIMGSHNGVRPEMVKFLNAQEVQAPIEIDTTWLEVGHTDEFMQFLPSKSQRGWVMLVDDPLAGLQLLQNAQKSGNGRKPAVSRPRQPEDSSYDCVPNDTINDVLNRDDFSGIQQYCADNIDKNIEILKRETGITDAEIIRVPSLYFPAYRGFECNNFRQSDTGKGSGSASDGSEQGLTGRPGRIESIIEAAGTGDRVPQKRQSGYQVAALYPGTINGVVLSDSQYVAPNPWGPIIDGKDILAAATVAAYAKANYTVTFMDDWFSHHVGTGEVHCGSNTIRQITAKWW